MDIRQLRYFVAVADTLHFGKAAEQLGISQPPLSQSIMALERELGAALFLRTKRSVSLTPFGAQWLEPVRAALTQVGNLSAQAHQLLRGEAGRLSLSFVSTADYSVLPTLVRRYRSAYPQVELTLQEATSDVQIQAITHSTSQVGIIIPPSTMALPATLAYRKLLSEPLVAAVPDSWLSDDRLTIENGALTAASVLDSPLIMFPRPLAPAFHDLVTGYYTACGGSARIVQQAIQMQTIISLVSSGMGLALVPDSLRHLARTGVRYLPLQGAVPHLETGIIWNQSASSPTRERFLEVVAAVFAVPLPAPVQAPTD